MIAVALRNLRHRPGGFVATFLTALLGAALLMAFASLIDTAAGADPGSADSLSTTAGVGGGWCLVIVAFAVTSTMSLSVRQRAEQVQLLRRIGATGPQLRRMIVGEAAVVALVASAAAVPVGLALGRVLVDLMRNTGQVAEPVPAAFGAVALGIGFGVTLLGSIVAGVATARRTAAPPGGKPERPRARRIGAVIFLLAATSCATLTATLMDGKGIDAMQTAGQAGIWASLGLALLAPELLRLVTAVLGGPVRTLGRAAGELAVAGVRARTRQLAGAVMPVLLFTGIATGTIYMQFIENKAAAGQIEPDYAQDVKTLNFVVIGMITLFVAVMLVNTLVAATAARRREFAQHRLAGATRGQLTAMVALEGLLVTITGALGGTLASLFTVVPFGSARADRLWPQATPLAYAVIVAIAVALTAAATVGATRRQIRGPAALAARGV
ncbi:FtsX-like permease family protein [Actinoplanes sp. NPDC026619]|uniref:FtsX-like permease family protein n=1 Tax=Actinoplanes sp. NPDC026619 TaxID=3155798 RepID=UPI0033FC19CA